MQRAKVGKVVQIAVESRHEEAAALLRGVRGVAKVDLMLEEGGQRMDVQLEPNAEIAASELAARLLAQGFRLARLQPEEISLETAFMRLTKGLVS
jgi:ABC-2 type transport system ATP-binding protein